jgi:naphthoate synthase
MTDQFQDIIYEKIEGMAFIRINRPNVLNAFRPLTIDEMLATFQNAWDDEGVGSVVLTGVGGNFCSGGDQRLRGDGGYSDTEGATPRLQIRHLHRMIRDIPKPVIAMVDGYAIGGGHILHVICDLTIASTRAVFGQTGPRVGSFDGGFGAAFLARIVGEKKAREIWYLCEQYTAIEALEMGLVNKVVPPEDLEETTLAWGRLLMERSPTAIRFMKYALNADTEHVWGMQNLAHGATALYYTQDEASEGRKAFLEKRSPDFSRFRKQPW